MTIKLNTVSHFELSPTPVNDHTAEGHHDQDVLVIAKLDQVRGALPSYRVRAIDGATFVAYENELFDRPDDPSPARFPGYVVPTRAFLVVLEGDDLNGSRHDISVALRVAGFKVRKVRAGASSEGNVDADHDYLTTARRYE